VQRLLDPLSVQPAQAVPRKIEEVTVAVSDVGEYVEFLYHFFFSAIAALVVLIVWVEGIHKFGVIEFEVVLDQSLQLGLLTSELLRFWRPLLVLGGGPELYFGQGPD